MSQKPRIYLTGASCAGVTTLGVALANELHLRSLDVDDYYWLPTDPPFTIKRPPRERVHLIQSCLDLLDGWVLMGSFIGWGDVLIREVDLIVFVTTPTTVRLRRLDEREARRHGARILEGGDMRDAHLAFRDWASRYDDESFAGRNRAQHERWLAEQVAPVLCVDGRRDIPDLVACVVGSMSVR